jgi:hypothetical protein
MPNLKSIDILEQIPLEWYSILREIQSNIGKESIIHGGAMRDLALGKEPHDIDIAVPYNPDIDGYVSWYPPHGWKILRETTKRQTDKYKDGVPQISGNIWNVSVYGILPQVQIIPYNFPRNWFGRHVINSNDFGMNQIGFDGNKLLYNSNFEYDYFNRVFTFRKLGTRYMAKNAIKRAENWEASGKYAGYKFDCSVAKDFLARPNSQAKDS